MIRPFTHKDLGAAFTPVGVVAINRLVGWGPGQGERTPWKLCGKKGTSVGKCLAAMLMMFLLLVLGKGYGACGPIAATGVRGSSHDLTSGSVGDPPDKVRSYCHLPSHANKGEFAQEPMSSSPQGQAALEVAPAVPAPADLLAGPSRTCLGCHDGRIASGALSRLSGGGGGAKTWDRELKDHHPTGFDYGQVTSRRGDLRPVSAEWLGSVSHKKIIDTLYGGRIMTCATCHDVHNDHNVSGKATTYNHYINSNKSTICSTCHYY